MAMETAMEVRSNDDDLHSKGMEVRSNGDGGQIEGRWRSDRTTMETAMEVRSNGDGLVRRGWRSDRTAVHSPWSDRTAMEELR